MAFSVNFNSYKYKLYNYANINNNCESNTNHSILGREIYTTWKYDEEGNLVYYTYDKKTGELISKTKYDNPYKNFIKKTF